MRIAITGPSGSGKTTLARELARVAGLRHVEIDALHHGPNWQSCGAEVLRERVLAATDGDGWVTDSTYHSMLGSLVPERADVLVWLDLPIPLVMWRLLRRSHVRRRDRVELWNGNVAPWWGEQLRYLIWPAFRAAFRNRREFPKRYAHLPDVRRLGSDDAVRDFVRSVAVPVPGAGTSPKETSRGENPQPETVLAADLSLPAMSRCLAPGRGGSGPAQSSQATAATSGSSKGSERQKTPPSDET